MQLIIYRIGNRIDRFRNAVFDVAPSFLHFTARTLGFAFGFQIAIAGNFAGFILYKPLSSA